MVKDTTFEDDLAQVVDIGSRLLGAGAGTQHESQALKAMAKQTEQQSEGETAADENVGVMGDGQQGNRDDGYSSGNARGESQEELASARFKAAEEAKAAEEQYEMEKELERTQTRRSLEQQRQQDIEMLFAIMREMERKRERGELGADLLRGESLSPSVSREMAPERSAEQQLPSRPPLK